MFKTAPWKDEMDDVLKWLPLVAASRLYENVDDKTKAWLLEMID